MWVGPEREAPGIASATAVAEGAGLTQAKSHPHAKSEVGPELRLTEAEFWEIARLAPS